MLATRPLLKPSLLAAATLLVAAGAIQAQTTRTNASSAAAADKGYLLPKAPSPATASAPVGASSRPAFADDKVAHALYDKMTAALRAAKTLYWEGEYEWSAPFNPGEPPSSLGHSRYTIWLKKPNYFRVEAASVVGKFEGVLIGDGKSLWLYWPTGRPQFSSIDEDEAVYRATRDKAYMTKPAGPGEHSIGHETPLFGTGMGMTILDPSTFHGYTDSLQAYIDAVRPLPAEKIGGQDCDGIEVSIMKGQRSYYIWLSRSDNLPRQMKQIVRVTYDLVFEETWTNVTINAQIADDKFAWKPPADWKEWRLPGPDDLLLKPGAAAPDFELADSDGKTIKLSQYRGQVVWLYIWRGG